jgi:uncharacterized surface protein with fasciclin (FAS1) repeats
MYFPVLLLLITALQSSAQTFLSAISQVPTLSNFTAFYSSNEQFASAFFSNTSLYPITVLVPNDDAFAAYLQQTGVLLTQVPFETLLTLIQYHTLVSNLSNENFTSGTGGLGSGLTTPTMLVNEQYNNRSAGSALASNFGGPERSKGQVVFITNSDTGTSTKLRLSRQAGSAEAHVRSGLSSTVNITTLDEEGVWEGGRIHIIDGLLTPPTLCKDTIRSAGLTGLDRALNRSGLWSALDSSYNTTCLGPSNNAFESAGSPDGNLTKEELVKALHFHTLPQVAYSDFLEDGQTFTSLENLTVRVKVEGTGKERQIWFNNAKVIDANVL